MATMEQIAQTLHAQNQSMTQMLQQVLGPLLVQVDAGNRAVAEAVAQRSTGGTMGVVLDGEQVDDTSET